MTKRGIVAQTEDLRPVLGHYALGDSLGQGSMAEVFSGFALGDHGYQKPVALKRLLPELASNRVFIERLSEEVKGLIGMQHRNIVSVLDLARDDNDVFLIMELVYGPSLRKLLDLRGARGLSLGVATYIVYSAALALEFAHDWPSGTIIHGDVTPSNLLLTTSGEVCVSDFGGGGHGLIEVRSVYMAPEQARREPPTPRSDVFALGVVLYELICGKHPFAGRSMHEQHDGEPRSMIPPRALNPRIPAGLEAICVRALAHDPRQRYQSMQALIDALAEERSEGPLHEGASELAQAILECSPHVLPRHPSTMVPGQSATMTVRSLLHDAPPVRHTPPLTTLQEHVERRRPPTQAPARPSTASVPAGARASAMVIDQRARAKSEAPPVPRPAAGTPQQIAAPVFRPAPGLPQQIAPPGAPAGLAPTAPARPIVPVDSAVPAGGYTAMAFGDPRLGDPVGARFARRHRWMLAIIVILATTLIGGIIFAAGFYLATKEVSPSVAASPPPAAASPPSGAVPPPPGAEQPPPVTVQTPPNIMANTGSLPVQDRPSETSGDTPDEEGAPRKKARGTLRVQTTPQAWVTIGKQKKQAPGAEFTLAPGYYTVQLEFPSLGITETKKVAIESRKTFTLNIDKEEEVEKVEETTDPADETTDPVEEKAEKAEKTGKAE